MDIHSFVHYTKPDNSFSLFLEFKSSSSFYNSILLTNDYYIGTILFLEQCLD